MKKVTEQEWRDKAAGLAEWRKNRTSPPNLDLYKRIVSMVHVGKTVLDVGCGQCHLRQCVPYSVEYFGIDPFPVIESEYSAKGRAENFTSGIRIKYETVFMLSALDNVQDIKKSLEGLRFAATKNIVILTGIGIPPDKNHTHQIDREDLVSVLGEPSQEIEISKNVFLFEWRF